MENGKTETSAINLSDMIPDLTEQVAASLRERLVGRLEYQMTEAVAASVRSYIDEKVLPEVQAELEKHHPELRAAFVAAVKTSVTMAAEKCVDATAKRLASYEGDKLVSDVIRTLMGGSRY